jgi:hypothetical protein
LHDVDFAVIDRQRMTERDEFMGALDGLHGCDYRSVEHGALFRPVTARAKRVCDSARQTHPSFGCRLATRGRFVADIDHGGSMLCIEVR